MPLPWKKPKSGRISKFVSDFQQSPKHGGSLVVETGFPTSLIDLFVKNRDRLKKPKRKLQTQITAPDLSLHRSSPPHSLHRRLSLSKLDPPLIQDESVSKSAESIVIGGLKSENRQIGKEKEEIAGGLGHDGGGGGCCALMVVAFKVFVVAILALTTKKLAVGITLSAFALVFLEIAAARVFKLCPNAQYRLDSLIKKLIKKPNPSNHERNVIFDEITESLDDSRNYKEQIRVLESIPKLEDYSRLGIQDFESVSDKRSKLEEFREANRVLESIPRSKSEVQTIRDVVFKTEKSKSSKLKSKIVKKIVPKKLRGYKKKKKMKLKEEEEALLEEGYIEEEDSITEVSSLVSEEKSERIESEISENDAEECSNRIPPLLENSCEEKGNEMNAIVLLLIVLIGLLIGKVLAIGLTLSWCLFLRFAVNFRSQGKISV